MKKIKREDLKDGDIAWFNGGVNFLNKIESIKDNTCKFFIYDTRFISCKVETEMLSGSMLTSITKATPEEKYWLETCIKENKFISYEDAMKTFKKEFVLPEKWYLKITSENKDIINHWRRNIIQYDNSNCQYETISQDGSGSGVNFINKYKSHTQITFEQFKKYVLKEQLEQPKDKVLKFKDFKLPKIEKVECAEGGIYQLGDKIKVFTHDSPNKGKKFTIKGFRWNNAKTNLCAITELHRPNGIGLDKIELYIEPKVEITYNFKIGDKISLTNSTMSYDNVFIVEKIEGNRLIINNLEKTLQNMFKSVLVKNVKLVKTAQELSLLEQAKLKYPIGTKFRNGNILGLDTSNQIVTVLNHDNFRIGKNSIHIDSSSVDIKSVWTLFENNTWAEIVEDFVLSQNWLVIYSNRKEFDIINRHFKKKWSYINDSNCGYFTNREINRPHNNWVSNNNNNFNSLSNLIKEGYTQITFEQFLKYVVNE